MSNHFIKGLRYATYLPPHTYKLCARADNGRYYELSNHTTLAEAEAAMEKANNDNNS